MSKSPSAADPPDVDLEKGIGEKDTKRETAPRDAGRPSAQDASNDGDIKLEEDEGSPYAQHCRDNARIWTKYLRETDNEDKEVTSIGNSSLDSMLTFAGLFASVLAAFLIESRKDLVEDPQERLLTELLHALRGTPEPSPTVPFQPTASALAVNTLWFTSLTLTLMSALAGVLAKGWLAQYNPVSRKERMEDAYKRQHRFNMAEIWGLSTVISLIPFGIQVSLFLFFAGLIIQIQEDDLRIRLVVLLLVAIAAILYICWTVSPLFIAEFPFPTPLSRYLGVIPWLRKNDWDKSGVLRRLGLLRESVLRVLGQYEPIELQLQILTWGVTSAADEETTDEAIKALSGTKSTTKLRQKLYNQELHRSIYERLQQKLQPNIKSSLMINNTSQMEAALLALLKIEQPLNLDDQGKQVSPLSSGLVPNWEEFKPCLQSLAFSLRVHMLVNRNADARDELWLQRVEAFNRMSKYPSTAHVRKIMLFSTLRGLLKGQEYTRRECGIVLSQLLMTLGNLEEIVEILATQSEEFHTERGVHLHWDLSRRITDLLSCEDRATRHAGARIIILSLSNEYLNDMVKRGVEVDYISLFTHSDVGVQATSIGLLGRLARDHAIIEYIKREVPRFIDKLQDPNWFIRLAAMNALGELTRHESFRDMTEEMIPQLVDVLQDMEPAVRYGAMATLRRLAHEDSHGDIARDIVSRLSDMLKHLNPVIQTRALETLGELAQQNSLGDWMKNAAPNLVSMLGDSEHWVSREIAKIFGQMSRHVEAKSVLPQLLNLFQHSEWRIRQSAVTIFGHLNQHEVSQAMSQHELQDSITNMASTSVEMFTESDSGIREAAVTIFGQLTQYEWLRDMVKDGVPGLVDMFSDSDRAVQKASFVAFGQLIQHEWLRDTTKGVIPQLVTKLKDPFSDIRRDSAAFFGQLAQQQSLQDPVKDAVSEIIEMLKHSHWWVREASVMVIGKLVQHEWLQDKINDAIPQIVNMLSDSDWDVRKATVTVFRQLLQYDLLLDTIKSVIPQIVELIKDSDLDVSEEATITVRNMVESNLLRTYVKTSMPFLVDLVKDGTVPQRLNAAVVFNSLASHVDVHDVLQTHLPLFVALLSRQDSDLQFSIIGVLSKLSVTSSSRANLQFSMLSLSQPNLLHTIPALLPVSSIDNLRSHSQIVPSPKSLFVQEVGNLVDGSDIEKWFNNRQSLWTFLHFLRRYERSFVSTIDSIAKGANIASIDALINAYQTDMIEILITLLSKLIKGSANQSRVSNSILKLLAKLIDHRGSKKDTKNHPGLAIGSVEDFTTEHMSTGRRWEYQLNMIQDSTRDAIPRVVDMLKYTAHDVRQTAASVYGQLAQHEWSQDSIKKTVPQVLGMLKHSDLGIRETAVMTFRHLAQNENFQSLITDAIPQVIALFKNSDQHMHQMAVDIFGVMDGHEWLHNVLKDAILQIVDTTQKSGPNITPTSIKTLGILAQYRSLHDSLQDIVKNGALSLVDMLQNTDSDLRQEVALAFESLAQYEWLQGTIKDLIPQILVIFKDSNSDLRCTAGKLVGELAQYELHCGTIEKLAPQLFDLLDDLEWNVRQEAITSIGRLAQREQLQDMVHNMIPRLFDSFEDPNSGVCQAVVTVFGQIAQLERPKYAINDGFIKLVGAFKHPNQDVRWSAVTVFGNLAQHDWLQSSIKDAIPQLMEAFDDSDPDVCEAVVKIFGQLAQNELRQGILMGFSRFVDMLGHPAWVVRQASVMVFGQLGQHEWLQNVVRDAIPRFVERFKDDTMSVHHAAIISFKQLLQQESLRGTIKFVVPDIVKALTEGNWIIRQTAVTVFGHLGQHEFFESVIKYEAPRLVEKLKDLDGDVRRSTVRVFGELAQYAWLQTAIKDVIPQFFDLFRQSEPYIRAAAVDAFRDMAQHDIFISTLGMQPGSHESLKEVLPTVLEGLCYDQDEQVVDSAAQLVSRLASFGYIFPTFVNVALYSLQELHNPTSTLRTCASSIWIALACQASLRPALYDLTAVFGGILYFEPEIPPKDVKAAVERMIRDGMLRIYHED